MALIALKCPHCGGDIRLDDTRDLGYCLYCGAGIAVRDEVLHQTNSYGDGADVSNVYNGQTFVTNNYVMRPSLNQDTYPILSDGHYEGPMVDGKPHGKGVFFWPNGVRYEGDFVEGRIEGFGRKSDGDAYFEGWFRNNLRHGHGRFSGDGIVMEAEFVDGVQSGPFRLSGRIGDGPSFVFDGVSTDGEWTSGRWENSDGLVFEGEMENLSPRREVMVLPNGSSFEGSWRNCVMDGPGTYRFPNGNYYEGVWKDGKRVEAGPLHTVKGNTYDTWDKDGNPTGHRLKRLLNGEL